MAKQGTTEDPGDVRTYLGRKVVKEVVNIGVGGEIRRDGLPAMPPGAELVLRMTAKVGADKHKFLDTGTVEAATILTIEAKSFEVLKVTEVEPDPELPLEEE